MHQELVDRLTISPLFQDIKYRKIDKILNRLNPRVKRYKKQEIVTFFGQPYDGIGVVASGKIAIVKESYTGNRVILDIMKTGDIFGEMLAFSDNKRWPLTIIAQEDSCLLFISLDKFVSDYANTSICRNIITSNLLKILSDYTVLLNRKIDYLSEKSPRSKLCMFLTDMYRKTGVSNLTIPMKRHELADYLNISRPALSKELGLMRDEGIIEFNGSLIYIKDISRLVESS